jgi:hypothetical protein
MDPQETLKGKVELLCKELDAYLVQVAVLYESPNTTGKAVDGDEKGWETINGLSVKIQSLMKEIDGTL